MIGTNAKTGEVLSGIDHLRQSVADILTTPVGSRVMRRAYGSRLFDLIDRPFSASLRLEIISAVAEALLTWEPRLALDEVAVSTVGVGSITFDLFGRYLPDGREVTLAGIEVAR